MDRPTLLESYRYMMKKVPAKDRARFRRLWFKAARKYLRMFDFTSDIVQPNREDSEGVKTVAFPNFWLNRSAAEYNELYRVTNPLATSKPPQ